MTSSSEFLFHSSLSVFFPAFNDAPSIQPLVSRTFEILRKHVSDFEVIVVNDGSTDETGALLERLKDDYGSQLRVVTHAHNQGYGGALRSGFAAASKEFVFYTDGDGQYDVLELSKLLQLVGPETGLVNGYKIKRNDPWRRIVIGAMYNRFARALFQVRLRDIDCDFRVIRRAALKPVQLTCKSGAVCLELVKKIEQTGTIIIEVPVNHYPRLHGRSQFFRIRSLANTFVELLRLHYRVILCPWYETQIGRRMRVRVSSDTPEV